MVSPHSHGILDGDRIEDVLDLSQLVVDNLRGDRHHCAMNAQNSSETSASPSVAPADFIAGMAKGMAVLESFDTERQRLNATLAAQRAGITRAAARRHLLTLAYLGYLETDGTFYWLSSKVLQFSGRYLATARLPRAVQPVLNRLAAQTGESFSAVVRDADEVVIVAKSTNYSQSHYQKNIVSSNKYAGYTPYGLHLGARLPLHATSTGRMLLAALNDAEFENWAQQRTLPRLTAHTCTDMNQFRGVLTHIREVDYAIASEEHELGVHALAVPLRNMQGRTVAALNVVTQPSRQEPHAALQALLPLLQEAATEFRALI